MPRTARRWVAVVAIVVGLLSLAVGRASGGPAVDGVTAQLQPPAALDGVVPDVPTPSVPGVSGAPVPSVPSVPDTSSVPDVPSVPSARVPDAVRNAVPSAGKGVPSAASGPSGPASSHPSRAASQAHPSQGSSSARGSRAGRVHAAAHRARVRTARQRHLRRDVERYAGCLGALPRAEGRVLAIRAGVGRAAPATLSQAARRLGISTHRAAALERSGLRTLRQAGRSGACGRAAARDRQSAALGAGGAAVPQLQPAVLLASHPALTSPAKLAAASSRDSATHGSAPVPGTAAAGSGGAVKRAGLVASTDAGSSKVGAYLAALAILALLVAAFVVAWRRRDEPGAPRLAEQTGTAAVWWPPTAGDPEGAPPAGPGATAESSAPAGVEDSAAADSGSTAPSSAQAGSVHPAAADSGHHGEDPPPQATPYPAPGPASRHPRRPAAMAAASLVSLGVALLRRRRRR